MSRGAAAGRLAHALRVGWAVGWAAPCSVLGLLVALPLLMAGARAHRVAGVLEVAFGEADVSCMSGAAAGVGGVRLGRPVRTVSQPAWLPFCAITLGHVVLGVSHDALARLRLHEHAHVRQYQRWGLLFLLAYPLDSLWQGLCGRSPYWHNRFEVDARAQEGRAQEVRAQEGRAQEVRAQEVRVHQALAADPPQPAQTSNRTPCASGSALE